MNQSQEEEQIKELFQQLKQDDERHTPSFARVWETAVSGGERAGGGWPILRAAVAALVLLMLAGSWFVFFRRPASERLAQLPAVPEVRLPQTPISKPPPKLASSNNPPRKVVRRPRAPARQMPLELVISQWRSPTDFLLKTPEPRWLKEVPRLGVPHVEIKPFVIEQNNEVEEL